jgi:predicted metalloprotease with PDZ domain
MRRSTVIGSWIFPLLLIGATACAEDHAYLGVQLGAIPEALGAHLKAAKGALVDDVAPGSPAEKAGLKRFDVVDAIDGKAVESPDQMRTAIQDMKPGATVKLGVVRGTESTTIDVTLGAVPAAYPAPKCEENPQEKPEHVRGFLGMGVSDVPSALAYQLNLKDRQGALVGDVVKGSPAEKAGIEKNDVITAIDGKTVDGSREFVAALSGKKPGDDVKIEFIDKGAKKTADAKLAEWPKELSRIHGGGGHLALPGGRSWFGLPHSGKGRMILKDPDGSERVFQLPETHWNTDELFRDLEKNSRNGQSADMRDAIKKALKDLEGKVQENGEADTDA